MYKVLFVVVVLLWPCAVNAISTVNWVPGLGDSVANQGSLAVVTTDAVSFNWSGGHNIYRADGHCDLYTDLTDFQAAASYTSIESTHPGQNPYPLAVPSVGSLQSFCYACITHFETMRFTLTVSPPVTDVVCIDDSTGVLASDGHYVVLSSVRVGDRLATPDGYTVVRKIIHQDVHDITWTVPAGTCGATSSTILSPSHAVRCDRQWKLVKEVASRATTRRSVRYMNLLTEDYCTDMLILNTGLVVETWDGRDRNEWRPHIYDNGHRINCQNM